MSQFEQAEPSYRLIETHFGDDLQAVAAREMGDANRWVEIVWLNKLVPPYLTDDPRRVAAGVKLTGSYLKVPAPVGVWTDDAESGQVYERDCALVGKMLQADADGDLMVVAGSDNLRQQLSHRIVTPTGQARRHPDYGCKIWRLMGKVNGPTAGLLGAEYVRASLRADYRVSSVKTSKAEVKLDSVRVTARAIAIEGSAVDLLVGE